jgi:hypothetical protein
LYSALNGLPFNDDEVIHFRSREADLFRKVINNFYDKDQRPPGVFHVGKY